MARPEAEIDGSTPEGEFALGLRALRDKARLDYRAMEKLVHFASSTLSKAASGNGLPTLDVTLAYVKACDGDVQEWEAKWRELRRTLRRGPRTGTDVVPFQRGSQDRRRGNAEKSPDRAGEPECAGDSDPALLEIPEQLTGDQVSGGELAEEPEEELDPEATDRIPRVNFPVAAKEVPGAPRRLAPRPGAHRAVPASPRRASAWVIVGLILLNVSLFAALICAIRDQEPASQTLTATTMVASSIQSFEIAEIEEPPLVLKAGAQEIRWVDLRNPNAADLVVTELIAHVKISEDDSPFTSRSCSADVLTISNLQNLPYRIDAKGKTRVGFKFEVSSRIPGGCEGRVIPVSYTGKAIQGTIIEGRPQAG